MMSEERRFIVTPGPHLWKGDRVRKLMDLVLHFLLFPAAAAVFFFGYRALLVIAVSVAAAVLTEYVAKKLRKRPFIWDGSVLITGLLLALMLPPTTPLWMVAVGSVFSIAIVKEAYGGLGHNIFNPALGGRAFMMLSFPAEMVTWVWPMRFGADAVATATPLAEAFVLPPPNEMIYLYRDMFLGNIGGSIGETSALMILIGGLLLIVLRVIDWRVPLAYIGTVALLTFVFGQSVIFHVLAGGLMLGAFFMATDYVTTPITARGRIIFSIGAGILTVLIRLFGVLPEGVVFSILIMNALTPLIDKYTKVRPYGLVKGGAK